MLSVHGELGARVRSALGYETAADAVSDPRGWTVRCTPRRLTRMQTVVVGGETVRLFRKVRLGSVDAAAVEWHWLRELPRIGVAVSSALLHARANEETVVATLAAPGRPLAALLRSEPRPAAATYACENVLPLVRRLHAQGLVFRDLYWNHLFAPDLDPTTAPSFIDVERVLHPRFLWCRWVVKDLAGLAASWPHPDDASFADLLARAYVEGADGEAGAGSPGDVAARCGGALAARIARKAERIRRHVPKFGA